MQLCKARPLKVRSLGKTSKVISLPLETLVKPGEERWIIRDEETGTILLVTDEEFKRKYAEEVGYDIR